MSKDKSELPRTELDQLGEFGLIDHLTKDTKLVQPSSYLGIGDDAAAIKLENDLMLVSSDMLIEGIHFDLTYTPLKHLGYKTVAVNISDIAAMNGSCSQITVNIGLSNRFSLEAVDELYEGIHQACAHYGCDLIGGDTTSSLSGLVISVTAIGSVASDKLVPRSQAKIHDLICVSGELGAAYVGLQILEREKQVFLSDSEMQPQLKAYEYVVGRQLKAEARTDIVQWLKDSAIVPTAMIDISDGLASDLLHICKQSGVGARIYEDKLPIDATTKDAATEFKLNPTTVALHGGEDYELLFTVSQENHSKIDDQQGISIIGHITDASQGAELASIQGDMVVLEAQGWRHFGNSGNRNMGTSE
jgi:thiamine-monophosphate kinase